MKYELWIDYIWQADFTSQTALANHIRDWLIRHSATVIECYQGTVKFEVRIKNETHS